jgi:hypothetical protein
MNRTIPQFFQTLGKSLVSKRGGVDGFQKQSHAAIADALAEAVLSESKPLLSLLVVDTYAIILTTL